MALYEVGNILLNYATDKKVPMIGFGAVIDPKLKGRTSEPAEIRKNYVNHCFHMNFQPNPEVFGMDGMLAAYNTSISQVEMLGPTYFGPFLKDMILHMQARSTYGIRAPYTIELILTDGEIMDMNDTIEYLVEASFFPVSIVIVGIGNDSFKNMKFLDSDGGLLTSRKSGKKAARDLVQFVPFREFQGDAKRLASAVLAEIPKQFLEYKKQRCEAPLPPIDYSMHSFEVKAPVTADMSNHMIEGFQNTIVGAINMFGQNRPK